ncbi:MAG TPA: hypothetical protein VK144_07840 [Bacillota bacterium]|nr:hypothetical protein [Bacillota bacterium]
MRGIYGLLLLLAGLLLIATLTDFFFLEIGVLILMASLVIWTQYSRLKHVQISKMIMIGIFVVSMVLVTASLFYYVYRPLLASITFQWLKVITSWVLMILTLVGVSLIIHAGIKKLTEDN